MEDARNRENMGENREKWKLECGSSWWRDSGKQFAWLFTTRHSFAPYPLLIFITHMSCDIFFLVGRRWKSISVCAPDIWILSTVCIDSRLRFYCSRVLCLHCFLSFIFHHKHTQSRIWTALEIDTILKSKSDINHCFLMGHYLWRNNIWDYLFLYGYVFICSGMYAKLNGARFWYEINQF